MAIPNIPSYTGQKPDPSQSQPEFNQNVSDELDYFNDLPENLNPAIDEMNNTATQVTADKDAAETSATAAQGYSNFQGPWSSATGAWGKGNSFDHNGRTWALLVDLADITTVEPGSDDLTWRVQEVSKNVNLLSNHNFLIPSPDSITHPSATPTDYTAETQIFSGVFVGSDVVGLTYVNGRVKWTNATGTIYFSVANSNGLEYVTEFTASVADFDGSPRTRGVSFSLVGDEYRVTVDADALEDVAANPTLLGSVKFERGSVATGHETESLSSRNLSDYTDIVYKASGGNSAVENMIAGAPVVAKVGDYCSTGGTIWVKVSDGSPDSPGDFKNVSKICSFDYDLLSNVNSKINDSINTLDGKGGEVEIASGSYNVTGKITVMPGVVLKGAGLPQTFDNFRTSANFITDGLLTEDDGVTLAPIIEIGEGTNNTSQRNRAIHVQGLKVIGPPGFTLGLGFSSVNTDYTDFTQSAFNFRMTDNVSENLLIGFRYRNSWNVEISKNVSIRCDTGHLYDGDVTSGGTSSLFSSNLSYLCRIGHDFQATGWTYTEMVGCGADGCEIAARFTGASYRGFSLKNFGFENADSTSGVGIGVLVDNGSSGILDIDGLLCGIHNDPNVIFIDVISCQRLNIRNSDIGSGVINDGKILNIETPANVGRVTIEDCDWFGDEIDANIGDVFLKEVTLINTKIAGRLYAHATGGVDIQPQRIAYTSGSSNYEAVDRDNKQIHSVTMLCDTNNDGSNRFIAGTPAFDTSQIPDGTIIEFVNATDATTPAAIGLRSEDDGVGVTGIVRDPVLNVPTTINLTNPGDRAKFQKRSDGKLYQLTLEQAGV